ncbi:MAG TPA: sigma-70 family RNA polymerase sigma factor [Dermatophilaceae bacterium]
MPRRQREVIELYYFVDLPVQQVAELLGISSGTVKSTLADARRSIQFRLAGEETS